MRTRTSGGVGGARVSLAPTRSKASKSPASAFVIWPAAERTIPMATEGSSADPTSGRAQRHARDRVQNRPASVSGRASRTTGRRSRSDRGSRPSRAPRLQDSCWRWCRSGSPGRAWPALATERDRASVIRCVTLPLRDCQSGSDREAGNVRARGDRTPPRRRRRGAFRASRGRGRKTPTCSSPRQSGAGT